MSRKKGKCFFQRLSWLWNESQNKFYKSESFQHELQIANLK